MGTFQVEAPIRTFQAGTGGVLKNRRVTLETDGVVEHSTAAEAGIGIVLRSGAEGDDVPVRLWNAPGTFAVVASGVIGQGVQLEGAADGKFAAIGGAGLDLPLMKLNSDTVGDGDEFEAVKLLV